METRDILRQQMMIRDVLERAGKLDCALVSVGGLGPESTMERLDLVSDADRKSLMDAGAVGDLLGHFIDADGMPVDHPLNRRVIAVDPKTLRDVPGVILASGGRSKRKAVRAALRGDYVDVLITDDDTAEWLLENP